MRRIAALLGLAALAGLSGCSLEPAGTRAERDTLDRVEVSAAYQRPYESRVIADLPRIPNWQQVLQRAFLTNGTLEATFFEWQAAVHRVGIASAYPNSNVALGYSYALSSEQMKTFDRMTLSLGFDSMTNLSLPAKISQRGVVALSEAQAAGERFRAAKFELQRRVLSAWADYVFLHHRALIEQERLSVLRVQFASTTAGASVNSAQQELMRAQAALTAAQSAVTNTTAEIAAARAGLNAMLGRPGDAALEVVVQDTLLPRAIPCDDAAIIAAAKADNPELTVLARQIDGRTGAVRLAELQWLPDINASAALTGGIGQMLGAAVMLPTKIGEIRGSISESQSMLRSAQASLRQARLDRASLIIATLVTLRASEQNADLYESALLPIARRVLDASSRAYSSGSGSQRDVLEARLVELDARHAIAEARTMREKRLAELEALLGMDIETITASSHASRNEPTSANHVVIGAKP